MNILYEGLKEKGALMLVPSTAVESMGLGGLLGAAALRQQTLAQEDPRRGSQWAGRLSREDREAGRFLPPAPSPADGSWKERCHVPPRGTVVGRTADARLGPGGGRRA